MAEIFSDKLNHDIEKFLVTYKFLAPEARALFEGQLESNTKGEDLKSKKLYRALLDSARRGLSKEQTIAKMQEVENG
ncbi:MAG: hypothetical protein NT099_04925 [Candidatus Saganbacteria bacterium]|nr:hypothetical protein [Candidatus Saganbacteria bacterium]